MNSVSLRFQEAQKNFKRSARCLWIFSLILFIFGLITTLHSIGFIIDGDEDTIYVELDDGRGPTIEVTKQPLMFSNFMGLIARIMVLCLGCRGMKFFGPLKRFEAQVEDPARKIQRFRRKVKKVIIIGMILSVIALISAYGPIQDAAHKQILEMHGIDPETFVPPPPPKHHGGRHGDKEPFRHGSDMPPPPPPPKRPPPTPPPPMHDEPMDFNSENQWEFAWQDQQQEPTFLSENESGDSRPRRGGRRNLCGGHGNHHGQHNGRNNHNSMKEEEPFPAPPPPPPPMTLRTFDHSNEDIDQVMHELHDAHHCIVMMLAVIFFICLFVNVLIGGIYCRLLKRLEKRYQEYVDATAASQPEQPA